VVENPGGTSVDAFGYALGLSGRTAIIGAPGRHDDAGTVYVLRIP
jgi:hypothetical protein